ncbi:hypothetical protein SAMN02910358_02345 [Lachnospiraceae bacterium XBB1006]|nr:hypothetical protein SAMN02910358_02345 [Lachnospiraceae bacterium XBB1006]
MKKNAKKVICIVLAVILVFSLSTPSYAASKSAGLAFGPVKIGNLEVKVTNPHVGQVPGMGRVNHINLHISKTSNGKDIANFHIVKQKSGKRDCLYVYESVSKKVVIDKCYDDWKTGIKEVVKLASAVVDKALENANAIATVAIWAAIVVVIIDLLVPMDPIPVIPFSTDGELVEI